jgi:hypothetical protein
LPGFIFIFTFIWLHWKEHYFLAIMLAPIGIPVSDHTFKLQNIWFLAKNVNFHPVSFTRNWHNVLILFSKIK